MRKLKKQLLAGAIALTFCLGGCQIGGREVVITGGLGNRDVFRIGGDSCGVTEAKVYLANYQNLYGKSYGVDLWERGFQTKKLKKYIKEIVLSEMTKIVCMDLLAKDQGISLSDEERRKMKKAASK